MIGTVVTAAIVGLAASSLFDFSLLEGLLLGAILAATDGAAVFALLRGVRLPLRLRRTLEGESGLNDPVAVLLVLVAIDLITNPHHGAGTTVLFLARELAVGVAVGATGGFLVARGAAYAHRLPVRQGFTTHERVVLAWAGLRGAVPVILATFAVIERVPRSVELLNIVFFAVLLSAVVQGLTVQALAARFWPGRADPTATPSAQAVTAMARAPLAPGPPHGQNGT